MNMPDGQFSIHDNAIRIIASVWGDDVARTIHRKNGFYPIDRLFT